MAEIFLNTYTRRLAPTVARVYGRLMIDRTSLEALYSRYSRSVWRRATRILADDDAAKDVTQEVFLRAIAVDAKDAFDASPMAWLYRVTTNLCLNRLRDAKRRTEILSESTVQEAKDGDTDTQILVRRILERVPEELQSHRHLLLCGRIVTRGDRRDFGGLPKNHRQPPGHISFRGQRARDARGHVMSTVEARRRPAGCLSDFTFDRLMAMMADPAAEDARAHLASCARCRNRLARVRSGPGTFFRKPRSRGTSHTRTSPKPSSKGSPWARRWTMPAVALAAAAALVVSARVKRSDEPLVETRTKGALSLDLVLRRPSGEVTRPAQGGDVFPGDALRFEVTAAQPGFVTVLGLDAAGAVTVYAPASESTIHLEPSARTVLPGSIVADNTLGPERIVALLCAQSQNSNELRQAALRALSQAGGDPQRVSDLGTACSETSFMIDKRARP